jgi:WD40 repeat protein
MNVSGLLECLASSHQSVVSGPSEDDGVDESGSTKRRKVTVATKKPLGSLLGSTATVNTVVWPEVGTVYSGGDDHAIRVWDVETATNSTTLVRT